MQDKAAYLVQLQAELEATRAGAHAFRRRLKVGELRSMPPPRSLGTRLPWHPSPSRPLPACSPAAPLLPAGRCACGIVSD